MISFRRGVMVALCVAGTSLPAQVAPPARAHHAIAYDGRTQRVLVSGGSTTPDGARFLFFDDLWSWDGARWRQLPATGPKRSSHRLVYDPDQTRVLMFGGFDGQQSIGELRVLSDTAWSLSTHDSVLVRAEPGVAYDTKRKRLVVFGGSSARGQLFADTWEYDGKHWAQMATTGPGPLQSMAMVYDEARGITLLFGGMDAGRMMKSVTWGWDGVKWRELSTTGPSPRIASGATYDDARKEVVLFGGAGSDRAPQADTWLWNGHDWHQASGEGPTARSMGYMAYDRARKVSVLFGGRLMNPPDAADTWEWNGTTWRRVQ